MPDMRDVLKGAGLNPARPQGGGPHGRPSGSTERRESPEARSSFTFPAGYPDYFDKDGYLNTDYVVTLAERIAMEFGREGLSKVQMRHFYNYVRRRQAAMEAGKDEREVLSEIAQLQSIAYRQHQRSFSIPVVFEEFIRRNAAQCHDRKSFLKGFVKHFQAVLAFSEGRLKERA